VRILYLAHRVPYPPTKGDKIRAYHQIAHLSRRHRIHLACLADTREDLEHARHMETLCASVDVVYRSPRSARLRALGAVPTGQPLSVAAFGSTRLRRLLARRLESEPPDLAYAFSSSMAPYIAPLTAIPRVIDFVDADSEKWRAYGRMRPFPLSTVYALEANRLGRYEGALAEEFDLSLFVSKAEADVVRRYAPTRALTVLPNGIDFASFRPPSAPPPGPPSIVFTGEMGYFPNVDAVAHFVRDVFPAVRRLVPEARFVIVGRNPAAAVRRLEQTPGVTVTGTVPDVRPYLAEARVAVAPFRIARGVPNKILEAMASGLPVVGTTVAFQALGASEEDGVRRIDEPAAFAREVAALLGDEGERADRGRRARRYVERNHSWDEAGARLEAMLEELVAARGAGRAHVP
jgi:sugar transferase (PEP-CTERM/EpsH1 system associated)